MTTENEQKPMQGVAERFVQAAEELRLSGRQLFRDGIVANDQVLSKIKNGWQKPTKKAIEAFCHKYGVSAAWMYTGEGCTYIGRRTAFEQIAELPGTRPLYRSDFTLCLDANGLPVSGDSDCLVCFPCAGDIDFWCINRQSALSPLIQPGDLIALKRLTAWREYLPGDAICIVITPEHKLLRKVSVTQSDDQSIAFTQMVDGNPVESSIPKSLILNIYKIVGTYRQQ